MTSDFQSFYKWLVEHQGYQPSTAKNLANGVEFLFNGRHISKALTPSQIAHYGRCQRLWVEFGGEPIDAELPVVTPLQRKRSTQRAQAAVSFDPKDLDALRAKCEVYADPASYVVLVLIDTGLRVSDVLRVQPEVLRAAQRREDGLFEIVVKGGGKSMYSIHTSAAWLKLAELKRSLPLSVAPRGNGDPEAGGAAYQAVRRHLKRLGVALDVDGRVHIHRLRRSFGVNALTGGASLHEVQKAMIHKSPNTTARYADETRTDWTMNAVNAAKKRG